MSDRLYTVYAHLLSVTETRVWTIHERRTWPVLGQNAKITRDLFGVRTFRRQTLRRQCRTFRRHIQLHKDRIPRHRHPRRVVECGLYAIVCVGGTSDIVGVTSVGETSCRRNVRTPSVLSSNHTTWSVVTSLYFDSIENKPANYRHRLRVKLRNYWQTLALSGLVRYNFTAPS